MRGSSAALLLFNEPRRVSSGRSGSPKASPSMPRSASSRIVCPKSITPTLSYIELKGSDSLAQEPNTAAW